MTYRVPLHPPAQPDETLYSLLSRWHFISGNQSPLHSLEIMVNKNLKPRHLLPCLPKWISQLSKSFLASTGLDKKRVLEEHTSYPYFRNFLTPTWNEAVRKTALKTYSGRWLGWSLPCPVADRAVRFCPECAVEDERYIGISYWHRSHQLPGVHWCFRHGCPLVPVTPAGKHLLILPSFIPAAHSGHSAFCSLPDVRFARFSHDLLRKGKQPYGTEQLFLACLDRVIAACGSLSAALRDAKIHLLTRFRSIYGESFSPGLPRWGGEAHEAILRNWKNSFCTATDLVLVTSCFFQDVDELYACCEDFGQVDNDL